MLKKRIIPCLDIKDGRTVKGINFVGLRDAGDPVDLAKRYADAGADELVFLDITATIEKRRTLLDLVARVAREIDIPFTVGGGVDTVESVGDLISAGADKVAVNSAAVKNPELLSRIAAAFGRQCLVLAIDAKRMGDSWNVFVKGGREDTGLLAMDWAERAVELGAGELLLTSMNSDGTQDGFALDIVDEISRSVNVPVIASGGAGKREDFMELFKKTNATAGLAASVFHFDRINIGELKTYLKEEGIWMR
jgi:cyclase